MAMDTLTITATGARNGETVDCSVIGLSDYICYTVVGTGTAITGTPLVLVSFVNADDNVIASGSLNLTAAEDGLSAAGAGIFQRLNPEYLKTSANAGDAALTATLASDPAVTGSCSVEVVIASAHGLKRQFFPGIPDEVEDEKTGETITLIEDAQVWNVIESAVSMFERRTGVLLRKKIAATDAYFDLPYGIRVQPQPLLKKQNRNYMATILPHSYVREVLAYQIRIGKRTIWELPVEWSNIDFKLGIVKQIPVGNINNSFSLAVDFGNQVPFFPIGANANSSGGSNRYIPNAIHYRYEAGWPEETMPIPRHWVQYLMRCAAMELADLWWMGLTQGLGSRSLSADGLSESRSRSDPGFAQAKQQWTQANEKEWQRIDGEIPMRIRGV